MDQVGGRHRRHRSASGSVEGFLRPSRPAPRPPWSVLRSTRRDAPVLPYWRHGLTDYLNSEVLQ